MKKNPHPPRNTGLSLIQVRDDREAMLMKMRGKLAGVSEAHLQAAENRKLAVHKSAFGWGWKIGIAAILALGNVVYFSSGSEYAVKAKEKRAPTLPRPSAAMNANDQALYWAYALYDFDLLKSKYGVSKTAIVNAAMAADKLRELLPKVDARTRLTIEQYTSRTGSGK
jgi:hypothetical protein